jgi:hypothetical protein
MVAVERVLIRHEREAHLLSQALEGNAQAANEVIRAFSSTDPVLRQAMQQTMHDMMDANLCMHLVSCLGTQRWDEHRDCEQRADAHASDCIDEAIIAVLSQDEYEWETAIKDSVLRKALKHDDGRLRQAAAFVLALRGDAEMIPALDAVIDEGKMVWKLRAIRGLATLDDERCAPALIKAVALDRDVYRNAAVEALRKLGAKAEPAWQAALNHPNNHVRWHTAYALGVLGDARGMPLLAEALFDQDSNVRWASVEVLSCLGEQALSAILQALSNRTSLGTGRQAIFQALKRAAFYSPAQQRRLAPLFESLHMPNTYEEAPHVARRLLEHEY